MIEHLTTLYLLRTRRAGFGESGNVDALLGVVPQVKGAVVGREEIPNVLVVDLQVGHGHLEVGHVSLPCT